MQSQWIEAQAALRSCAEDERGELIGALRAGQLQLMRLDQMTAVPYSRLDERPPITAHLRRTDLQAWRDSREQQRARRQTLRDQWLSLEHLANRWGMDRVECIRAVLDNGIAAYSVVGVQPDEMGHAYDALVAGRAFLVEPDRLVLLAGTARINQFLGPRARDLVDVHRRLVFVRREDVLSVEAATKTEGERPPEKRTGRSKTPGMDEALALFHELKREAESVAGGSAVKRAIAQQVHADARFRHIKVETLLRNYSRQSGRQN